MHCRTGPEALERWADSRVAPGRPPRRSRLIQRRTAASVATERPPTYPRSARRRAAAPPRVVLFWCFVLALVAIGMYAAAPWVLPVRVIEGPMVQMAGEDGVTLVWWTSRPAVCTLVVLIDGAEQLFESKPVGARHAQRITGLEPGANYTYRIQSGSRRLTSDIVFQTNRAAGERFTFAVFGDSGKGSRAQFRLAEAVHTTEPLPDLIVHTGDIVYPDGARRRYTERFFAPYRRTIARVNFWPCLGNHDVEKSGAAPAYDEIFDVPDNGPPGLRPGHNYWFDYGDARFVVIDSTLENAGDAVLQDKLAPWLADLLKAPAPTWRFVFAHHPPYTVGKYQPDARLQRALVPIFEKVGVDIVFSGHDHGYQRWSPMRGGRTSPDGRGVIYIVTGAGGAELYDAQPRDRWPDAVAFVDTANPSFTQVTVDGPALTLRQIDMTGRRIDELRLERTPSAPMPATAPATAPAELAP